ncbi:hypothetical protein D5b_00470 [Faustovirus]|nr:hypothetical protein D5b_00470 [Faustovirus]AMN84449.1 hypothetical protein D6_00038 [Faustovirus]AMP44409.1 hypothetical protein PRJ_Dakar_00458 [Faustovirus]
MQASGNDYTCVAYTGGKSNKTVCGMAAKYKLPDTTVPTHCTRHYRDIQGTIRDNETPKCCIPSCKQACPTYGLRGNPPTVCSSCYKSAPFETTRDFIDATTQCRFLYCGNLATHGATNVDLLPWLCHDHAKRMKFACSVIFKSKCLHCDKHAAYVSMGLTYAGSTEPKLAVCSDHVYELMTHTNMKFETVIKCQLLYCSEFIQVETKATNPLGIDIQCHGLCAKHVNCRNFETGLCEVENCTDLVVYTIDGKQMCKKHLNQYTCKNINSPPLTPGSVLTQMGKLPRAMSLQQQCDLINTLMMQTATPSSGLSAGVIAASRKRTVSQCNDLEPQHATKIARRDDPMAPITPATPATLAVPATPAISATPTVSIPNTPSVMSRSDPNTPVSQISNSPESLFMEIMPLYDIDTHTYTPSLMTYEEAVSYGDTDEQPTPIAVQTPMPTSTEIASREATTRSTEIASREATPLAIADIIKQIATVEYAFDFVYYSATNCYVIKAPIPIFILVDDVVKDVERCENCVLVRLRQPASYEKIRDVFYSIGQAMTSPFMPKFCEYDIY